ncbi:MAG: XRE family transcriptional regulator [Oscillatoriales cyanobacterium]|nr:MAG: XRE family transcriptional regulator [Oscillatoriales cyanobacterium]
MGRAGTALKRTLEQHGISQGRLAAALQIGSSNVYRWCNEVRDPNGETIVEIVEALKKLQPEAARDFVQCYLGELVE